MTAILKQLVKAGDISYLSYYFAEFIAEQADAAMDDLLVLSAALVSERNQQGDVCVLLDEYHHKPLFSTHLLSLKSSPLGVDANTWQQTLLASPCVGKPGDLAPLILEQKRLYLSRFWFYETKVAESILERLKHPVPVNYADSIAYLRSLFPDFRHTGQGDVTEAKTDQSHDQMNAVAIAARHRFSVISGGPGTGKTTTIIKLLCLLLSQAPEMRIQLIAPTGKAAVRMVDSIRSRVAGIEADDIRELIPTEAITIHRLLGYANQTFSYSSSNLLAVDCVVVDEASMIDLTLMYHLLDALPKQARVILLGDRDQLASVAAGYVLGDITGHGLNLEYSASQNQFLDSIKTDSVPIDDVDTAPEPIMNAIALLKHSYRFRSDSSIGQLAALINQGSGDEAIDWLSTRSDSLYWHNDTQNQLSTETLEWVLSHYQAVIQAKTAMDALNVFENIRILTAARSGPLGTIHINHLIKTQILERDWITSSADAGYSGEHYQGEPFLITQNDYELNLFNGDIGIIWKDAAGDLRAYFRNVDGSLRELPLQNLRAYEPAWAMTVHKSQGSEFGHVLLILPSPQGTKKGLLSRELLYTGTTRASQYLYIHAPADALVSSCKRITQRYSGLAQKLGWHSR